MYTYISLVCYGQKSLFSKPATAMYTYISKAAAVSIMLRNKIDRRVHELNDQDEENKKPPEMFSFD